MTILDLSGNPILGLNGEALTEGGLGHFPELATFKAGMLATDPQVYVPLDGTQLEEISDTALLASVVVAQPRWIGGPQGFPNFVHLDGVRTSWRVASSVVTSLINMLAGNGGKVTAMCWWRSDLALHATQRWLFRLGPSWGFGVYRSNGSIFAAMYDAGFTLRTSSVAQLNSPERGNGWQHAGIRVDGTYVEPILNGRVSNRGTGGAVFTNSSTTQFSIGSDGAGTGLWAGDVAHVAVWDRPLTEEEIFETYLLGVKGLGAVSRVARRPVWQRARTDGPLLSAEGIGAGPSGDPDIDLVLSVGVNDSIPSSGGDVAVIDGALGYYRPHSVTPEVRFIDRVGDTFTIPVAADASGSFAGGMLTSNVAGAPVGDRYVVTGYRSADQPLMHFDIDGVGPTATPVAETFPWSGRTPDHGGAAVNTDPRHACALDDTHIAVLGSLDGATDGAHPVVLIAEYGGATPVWTGSTPMLIGERHGTGGLLRATSGSIGRLVRIDTERVLAVWRSHYTDTQPYHLDYRPLHAQVLRYDLTRNTIEPAGPVETLTSVGEWPDEFTMVVRYIADEGIVMVGGIHYDDYPDAVDRYKIMVRTFEVGVDDSISELDSGTTIAEMSTGPGAATYFYAACFVGVGLAWAVAYSDVDDNGGDIRVAKFRIGTDGVSRGKPVVYDDDILIAGGTTDFEILELAPAGDLNATESLIMFEHYTDNYATTTTYFLLAKAAT